MTETDRTIRGPVTPDTQLRDTLHDLTVTHARHMQHAVIWQTDGHAVWCPLCDLWLTVNPPIVWDDIPNDDPDDLDGLEHDRDWETISRGRLEDRHPWYVNHPYYDGT